MSTLWACTWRAYSKVGGRERERVFSQGAALGLLTPVSGSKGNSY